MEPRRRNEDVAFSRSARELQRFRTDESRCRKCPRCGRDNDVDARLCQAALLEVTILDAPGLIAARGDALHSDLEPAARASAGARVLIEPERIVGIADAARVQGVGQDAATYANDYRLWTPGDEVLVNLGDDPMFAKRDDAATWDARGSRACYDLAESRDFESADWFFGPLAPGAHPRPQAPVRCRLDKWAKCGQWHSPRWYKGPKLDRQPIVVARDDVPVLCLTRQASHGLDLSYLTHIALLEPIRDSALLEQVVSRAHRVGAAQSVRVMTLQTFVAGGEKPEKTYICDHCYKSFATNEAADAHMLKCSRNPDAVDVPSWKRYTMSAVFDELKPPPCGWAAEG